MRSERRVRNGRRDGRRRGGRASRSVSGRRRRLLEEGWGREAGRAKATGVLAGLGAERNEEGQGIGWDRPAVCSPRRRRRDGVDNSGTCWLGRHRRARRQGRRAERSEFLARWEGGRRTSGGTHVGQSGRDGRARCLGLAFRRCTCSESLSRRRGPSPAGGRGRGSAGAMVVLAS